MKSVFIAGKAIASILILVALCLLFVSTYTPFSLKGKAQIGQPYSFVEDKEYLSPITDYAAGGALLYVLYEELGIVKIYDVDGTYIKTHFFAQLKNGRAEFYSTGDALYLEDRGHNLYLFRGADVDAFLPARQNEETRRAIHKNAATSEEKHKVDDTAFIEQGALSLYRVDAAGEKVPVVERPFWLFPFSPKKAICLLAISMLLAAACQKALSRLE